MFKFWCRLTPGFSSQFFANLAFITLISENQDLLSHTGIGALQLPEGKQVISGAPMREFPFAHDNRTLVFIFVLGVLRLRPLRDGICGQCTAKKIFSLVST